MLLAAAQKIYYLIVYTISWMQQFNKSYSTVLSDIKLKGTYK
jgi:hypothetical protein